MDINIVYNNIIEKLKDSGHTDVVSDLENSAVGAATGSEALMQSAFFLSGLKNNNILVYQLIKEEIREYLNYCKENGLSIK